jgi:predicted nucleic acid-binding protein
VIAVDTSSWIAYLAGDDGEDATLVDQALRDELAVMPPAVLCELLSDPRLSTHLKEHFMRFPLLETGSGYWTRTSLLRANVLKRKHRARLADSLIAQSCIDHDVTLITRDSDFRWFARYGKLKLLAPR